MPRKQFRMYPDGTFESFTYDANGNNITATDRSGLTVTMKYDKLDRMTEKMYADGNSVSSKYDARNRVTEQKDQNGNVTGYTYDGADRLTSLTQVVAETDLHGKETTFYTERTTG